MAESKNNDVFAECFCECNGRLRLGGDKKNIGKCVNCGQMYKIGIKIDDTYVSGEV